MTRFLSLLFFAAGVVPLPCIASAATLQVTDLGPATNFIGVPLQSPVINDQGQVAGVIDSSGSPLPFIWKDGVRTDLPNLPGATQVSVTGINNSGQVVGYSNAADGNIYAVTWQGGVISKLHSDEGKLAFAFGINDSGLIVGAIADRPVLWDGDSVTDLGAANGTAALAINNSGVISGGRLLGGAIAPLGFLWQNGALTDLGPQGVCVGTAINDEGVVAGIIQFPIDNKISNHAMTYHDGVVTDLGATPGGIASVATGLNDLGQVIGVGDMNGASPFIWQEGQLTKLQSLLPQDSPWLLFGGVSDINNHGQIVGIALDRNNSNQRELVMLTIPEPSSLFLLLIGLAALGVHGRRKA